MPKRICGGPWRLRPKQIGRLIDLARLFTKQGRYQEADLSLAKAEQDRAEQSEADVREGGSLHQKQAES